ncbi:hypothetical protein QJS04_geneDACA018473 [Acorus gramineus]|uniref:Reverse transcriptase domain-containing protein n=1 Tax=Acorus gramineus TaxID=55184 RepID=A0AAV9AYQ2_ACOGR|nr:hypothetical protein QJS04_geneDACA018473 [Acorus gramineus]
MEDSWSSTALLGGEESSYVHAALPAFESSSSPATLILEEVSNRRMLLPAGLGDALGCMALLIASRELSYGGELRAVKKGWGCCMGDFNVTGWEEDRNRNGGVSTDMRLFSEWIEFEGLIDLPLSWQSFTWSSLRENPSLSRLDRVLIDSDWEDAFPSCALSCLPRVTSDHCPLLLKGGSERAGCAHFRFETWWLQVGVSKRVEKQRRKERKATIALQDTLEECCLMGEEERAIRNNLKMSMHAILNGQGRPSTKKWSGSIEGLPKLSPYSSLVLGCSFSEVEIRRAIFDSEGDKAPGPDGFSSRFFQVFWQEIKADIFEMFEEFQSGSQGVGCLNATFLALILKKLGAEEISDFRPISLINACYKFIAKTLANRLKEVIGDLIEVNQTAFVPGRSLQEGFLAVQEAIFGNHSLHRQGIIIKIDFRKAYDQVDWSFMPQVLVNHGFG